MLNALIPNFEQELDDLREIGSAGFILAFNMSFRGPEYMHSEYPDEWREEYEDRNYFALDPVLAWTLVHSGSRRWSEVKLPDVRGVLKRAQAFGLIYGAVFSRKKKRKRSFLTVARSDRELNDTEILLLNDRFDRWCEIVTNKASLTSRELDVLRSLRDGLGQREIAEALSISESTVKQRAQSAVAKLGASNRTQAVAIAMTRGFLDG
ncbi:autoinducer binding domain-containing protein [Octadecabacter sp. R77987]|uniref:helix-turn-helix transcriptional regulator n=1 Tax=Octadecabacter sp. R77987 TaxID=3093874 RepID=UPI00366F354D